MTVGLDRWAHELTGNAVPAGAAERLLALWEDVLTLVVDPESAQVREPAAARARLEADLARAGIDPERFWRLERGRRSRLFLSRYSRTSRAVPRLEISAFDLDKVVKERFRQEPLTLGAAWHYGLWRSYFSHAAITHPANDGLREEFSTAWHIARKQPAVLFRRAGGVELAELPSVRLELPILVGPLPHSDGRTMEIAYLRAIAASDPLRDRKTRTLLGVHAADYARHAGSLAPHAAHVLPRFAPADLEALFAGGEAAAAWEELLARAPMAELVWHEGLAESARGLRERWPHLLLSVYLRYHGGFWAALEEAVAPDGVALVQVHAGERKSYRLIPQVDSFLKERRVRARIQLVNAGGDTDAVASAAAVYEAVLLGANGGAMTHLAEIALVPELIDVHHGADPEPIVSGLAVRDPEALYEQALNTLACWQHSILDFLSCMGIDDVQKTSGNTMAITMTEDWVRDVDRLATAEFAETNRELNRRRVAREPVPPEVRDRFRVSALLRERRPGLPLVHAARIQEQRTASWHLENLNRSLGGDHLEVLYRMAAGRLPEVDDFFLDGDLGPWSLDGVRLRLTRDSVAWSLERLRRDPSLLDYVQLAVPRGFERPGAAPPGAACSLHVGGATAGFGGGEGLARWRADGRGGFTVRLGEPLPEEFTRALAEGAALEVRSSGGFGEESFTIELIAEGHGLGGETIARASRNGTVLLKRHPGGGYLLTGLGVREPIWQSPVSHASISLGAASEDFLTARVQGNAGLAMVSSGEGGPIRLASDEEMAWESLQAASAHFGIHARDLRRVRDVEIKINQGAKPGKGGRLAGAKVTPQVSRARNIPVGTDALSPDPKHDIYSIEDMPAEVWLWLLYHTHCGIKISGSNYTKYVAAGMWSNFIVDYLLIDAGLAGSGNYHADSSHVGWPDVFRTILHTHHALVGEKVDLEGTGVLRTIRDDNGAPFGATGGTRLFASGGLRDEVDMVKVLCAGADGLVVASIDKAVGFGCNQCGNCHLDCPRGGITTKPELTHQNDLETMRLRTRNWTVLNLVKLAVLVDAINKEQGAFDELGRIADESKRLRDLRELRGRVDLLELPDRDVELKEGAAGAPPEPEHDSCRVGSLAVTEPVDVRAVWEAARISKHGGNNRGGGIDFAGFAPAPVAESTCLVVNVIGPDRDETIRRIVDHLEGCTVRGAAGGEIPHDRLGARLAELRIPVRERYAGPDGWREAGLRENVGDFYLFFLDLRPEVLARYARTLLGSDRWLQRRTRFGDLGEEELLLAVDRTITGEPPAEPRLWEFVRAVREEYFSVLAHMIDSRYYRVFKQPGTAPGKFAGKRSGHVVSIGEDLAAIKISGWTHVIPEYFDFENFWAGYPEAREAGGVEWTVRGKRRRTQALWARVWGMHHRYPTNSPAIDEEGRGNPAGAHPFKAYNLLLMHNGEQVGVDSTAPFLAEYGYVHADESLGADASIYEGDSIYERKALTDTEYAAYLADFTRRVLGLTTEEATQIISPITGLDLAALDAERRRLYERLSTNYVQLTPTGPYKFTIVECRPRPGAGHRIGFRENMDIKFLRPHEIIVHADTGPEGVRAVANGSEARIADAMLRVLHEDGVLLDAAADLRFHMRPGGRPDSGEFGGVAEAFLEREGRALTITNRFGETIPVPRAGTRAAVGAARDAPVSPAEPGWKRLVDDRLRLAVESATGEAERAAERESRPYGPEDELPPAARDLVDAALERVRDLSHEDWRWLVEAALPELAEAGPAARALAVRVLTELRKRLIFADTGGKSLAALEYGCDGGRDRSGSAEGGIYRILDRVPALSRAWGESPWLRIDFESRHDLVEPRDPLCDVLVIDFAGFESEAFTNACASRFLSEAVRAGWRNVIGYDFVGGPRYVGTNLAWHGGEPARGVTIELYGREFGDFLGALLEGARIYVYGQAQSHAGMKADSGRLFVLQDALNTCAYSAHGFTFSAWDTGSRFAVAGQNKVHLEDGLSRAPGFQSVHLGSPNEYAFEYLMSGGENSCHVVLGLAKPDERGALRLRSKPYAGKFLLSGAAAGRVFLLDPERALDPLQYHGNLPVPISQNEWERDVATLINREAWLRGAPIRAERESFAVRLDGAWRTWSYQDAFVKLIPLKVARALQEQGVAPPGLAKIVGQ